MAHHGEVVSDEHVRHAELVLEIVEQVHDAGLDRHVERRHRFVEHDQRRVEGERSSDPDSLALATGELVRKPARVVGGEPDELEQVADHLLVITGHPLDLERLGDRRADRALGVERCIRVLEHDLHLPCAAPAARCVGMPTSS